MMLLNPFFACFISLISTVTSSGSHQDMTSCVYDPDGSLGYDLPLAPRAEDRDQQGRSLGYGNWDVDDSSLYLWPIEPKDAGLKVHSKLEKVIKNNIRMGVMPSYLLEHGLPYDLHSENKITHGKRPSLAKKGKAAKTLDWEGDKTLSDVSFLSKARGKRLQDMDPDNISAARPSFHQRDSIDHQLDPMSYLHQLEDNEDSSRQSVHIAQDDLQDVFQAMSLTDRNTLSHRETSAEEIYVTMMSNDGVPLPVSELQAQFRRHRNDKVVSALLSGDPEKETRAAMYLYSFTQGTSARITGHSRSNSKDSVECGQSKRHIYEDDGSILYHLLSQWTIDADQATFQRALQRLYRIKEVPIDEESMDHWRYLLATGANPHIVRAIHSKDPSEWHWAIEQLEEHVSHLR